MSRKYWRGREIDVGPEVPEHDPLGPNERDRDLFEEEWWQAPARRDRRASSFLRYGVVALSILAVLSMLLPMIAAVTQ